MRDVLSGVLRWVEEGSRVAVATVIGTWSSAPMPAGSSLAVKDTGEVLGSISGGCVEGAVYELAMEVIADGTARLAQYGVSDGDALSAGLTCGGVIDVIVSMVEPDVVRALAAAVAAGDEVALATVVSDGPLLGSAALVSACSKTDAQTSGSPTAHTNGVLGRAGGSVRSVLDDVSQFVRADARGTTHSGGLKVFVTPFSEAPRMIVFGAVDYAAAVSRIGRFLGYHVTVCDARSVFATPERFPDADEVVVSWPHAYLRGTRVDDRTVICVLTHDPKFDIPLLEVALRLRVAYVGAMGSRRTHERRVEELRTSGLDETHLARLRSPIGLDLGASTPEETAVSIAAEIIASRSAATGQPLGRTLGSIHPPRRHGDAAGGCREPSSHVL